MPACRLQGPGPRGGRLGDPRFERDRVRDASFQAQLRKPFAQRDIPGQRLKPRRACRIGMRGEDAEPDLERVTGEAALAQASAPPGACAAACARRRPRAARPRPKPRGRGNPAGCRSTRARSPRRVRRRRARCPRRTAGGASRQRPFRRKARCTGGWSVPRPPRRRRDRRRAARATSSATLRTPSAGETSRTLGAQPSPRAGANSPERALRGRPAARAAAGACWVLPAAGRSNRDCAASALARRTPARPPSPGTFSMSMPSPTPSSARAKARAARSAAPSKPKGTTNRVRRTNRP